MSDIVIRGYVGRGFEENGYLVWRDGAASAIAVDPGAQTGELVQTLETEGLGLEAIVLTHAHVDHVEGVEELKRRTGAQVWLHPDDRPLYDRAAQQAAMFGIRMQPLPPIDRELAHGETLRLAGIDLEVRHVPGHSPGHVILYIAEAGAALVGDVIFQASIGRTDLPGGDFVQLVKGIRRHVFSLPGDTILHTGHGPATTVAHELATNPFLVPQYGGGRA